ncbi:MAG: glycosyltransferase family A protein [Daejeonella sp.]
MNKYKVSFCTTCMNRLQHLSKTLISNINDNTGYENLEFILLDYNSSDGLEEFINKEFDLYIKTGRLIYYRTTEPEFYNMSHSRNLAFKLSSGDIICNIDADNFTGKGFAEYVNAIFNENNNIFLSTHDDKLSLKKDVLGRICVKKKDFFTVGGYDEAMQHYGFDDYDFANRLIMSGVAKQQIENPIFLEAILHSNKERISNGIDDNNLQKLLIKYHSPSMSELIFLFDTKVFKRATMVNNYAFNATSLSSVKRSTEFDFSIMEEDWIKGEWKECGNTIQLLTNLNCTEEIEFIDSIDGSLLQFNEETKYYYVIKNPNTIRDAIFFLNQLSNRLIMEKNRFNKRTKVNQSGFGKAVVYRNFSSHPLLIA